MSPYPDEPGVHGAEHGAARRHGVTDLIHVVHQPAELHGAEVRADGEPRFVLQGEKERYDASRRREEQQLQDGSKEKGARLQVVFIPSWSFAY